MSSKHAAARVGGVLALSMSVFAVTGQAQAVTYDPQQTLPFVGLAEPESVAMDAQGNLYVADAANGRVAEISPGADGSLIHGTMSTVASGLSFPFGLTLDGTGNLYVSSGDSNAVYEVTPGSDGQWSDGMTTLLSLPDVTNGGPLATDANGDLFVVDPYTGELIEHQAGSGAGDTVLAQLGGAPRGLAVDSQGRIDVTEGGTDQVIRVVHTASKVTQTTLTFSGLSNPQGIAAGPSGSLIVSDVGLTLQGQLLSLVPKTATSSALPMTDLGPEIDGGYGGGDLYGVLVGPHGEFYAADSQNNRVLQLPVSIKPVVAITSAVSSAGYSLGQHVPTSFTCSAVFGIASCADSTGASGGAGSTGGTGALDTSHAGGYTYTVTATSVGGERAAAVAHYGVLKGGTSTGLSCQQVTAPGLSDPCAVVVSSPEAGARPGAAASSAVAGPSGRVKVTASTGWAGSCTLVSGRCVVRVPAGTSSQGVAVNAVYAGSSDYNASGASSHFAVEAQTRTGVTCAAQHVAPGGSLRCTASVINLNSNASPQGQLSFSGDGSFSPQSCTARTCSTVFTAPSTPGPYQITASFAGYGPFDSSSGSLQVPN